ncbi:LamG-like jellyroll fold domain-containing protein [Streptomyces tanashiensis]|uniref:LamG-like jellyroll fold domain-containing protein n=1 Tax=Streptomyces tanashiensis TaxID=67367 RepID=UPI0033F97C65
MLKKQWARQRARSSTIALSAIVMALGLPAPAVQATAPSVATTTDQNDRLDEGHRALAEAKKSGERVEVQGERSERTTVFANPDGYTFTLEQSSVPVRVTKPGGGWQTPDATLVRRSDGSIGPKAASAVMTFSRGGSADPLVSIEDQGRALELDWQGSLPAPSIDGSSALYREVLPDVDLKVTATVESFQHVLVVKSPKAAANPKLKQLTFGLKAKGLDVRKGAAGNLSAVDDTGKTVFRAPPAQMWNSAGRSAATPAAKQKQASPAADGQPSGSDASRIERAPSGKGLAPGQGDKVSRMGVKLGKGMLSVVPDTAMLATSDASAFPLFIDPTVTWGESERTLLRSDGYESYGWGNGTDGRGQGVGECGSWNGYYCGPGYVQRLYFEFAPDQLKGKRVLDATFAVTEPWAFQCDPRTVDLVRTDNISSATTWAGRPKELDWMVDRSVSAGRGSLCDPDSPDAPIEFNDNPEEDNENLTPTVASFAAGNFSRLTLELRAHDEADTSAWKRFKDDAVLRVNYVAYPAKPTGAGIVGGSGTVCSTNSADPTIVSDPTPTLNSTPQTAAGGEAGAKLKAWFRIETQAANGTWSGSGVASPAGTGFVGDNGKVTYSWASNLAEGPLHRYLSLTQVYYDNNTHAASSGYTPYCYFKVDPTAPKAPTVKFDGPYVECTTNNCPGAGAPGVVGGFTFGPAAGDTNKQYEYRVARISTTWTTLAVGVVKATVKPTADGMYTLEVRAKDTLGRGGATKAVQFKVASGEEPAGRWRFDEASGTALDSAPIGGVSNATLTGLVNRDSRGRRGLITHDADGVPLETPVTDKGLIYAGTDGYASTAGPVVATGSSYTVSTWVRLEDGSRNNTALGQDGTMTGGWYSAFYLGYRADSKKWELRTSPKDATDGDISNQIVQSKRPAVIGAWTHLAAVYDNSAKVIKLYVNGELQGTHAVAQSWTSTGKFQIGRVWWRGAYYDYWKGSIDEVAAWQRALIDSEIEEEAALTMPGGMTGVELVGSWSGSDSNGTIVGDPVSEYGRVMTLEGGVTSTGEEIVLDGVDDAATVTGPVIDDTGSFTVSTQVALDRAKVLAKGVGYTGQVVGQRTTDGSSWGLWFRTTGTKTEMNKDTLEEETLPVGYWFFGRLNTDGTFSAVQSDVEAELGATVRLTGIFDAQKGEIALRVGTRQSGVWEKYTAQAGAGDVAVGKGMTGAVWKHFLPAKVADVRLWVGAMNNENQIEAQIGS